MKKTILLGLVGLCFTSTVLAQQEVACANNDEDVPNPINFDPNAEISNYPPVAYNVFFWAIYPETYVPLFTMTEEECLEAIGNLNREFNKFNIFFKYRGFDYLYNDTLHFVCDTPTCASNCSETNLISNLENYSHQPGNNKEDMLNIFVYGNSCGFSGVFLHFRNIAVRSLRFDNWHTVHEMGHLFGLDHTHFNYNGTFCEHVTRDPNHPSFNATTRGDKLVDTPAIPVFGDTNGYNNNINPINCLYVGDGRDCEGTLYDIDVSDVYNMMNNGTECPDQALYMPDEGFTMQQGLAMRQYILENPNILAQAETDISALYEPYKGEYYLSGPNTGNPPLFQPGFRYKFVECSCACPQPTKYETTNFSSTNNTVLYIDEYETDYSSITHPNHTAIVLDYPDPLFSQPRMCYDNWNRAAKDGNLTKFNDGVFNQNVTVMPKDSLDINSTQLIPGLPAGLYKIQKNYHDGAVQETVIIKENEN